jgi:uncharacterized iron-regulated membrane protein
MYRGTRQVHKWIGIVLALFLALIALTGFLLAIKGRVAWMRPPEATAQTVESAEEVISIAQAVDAVLALERPEIRSVRDIDRIDYRPRRNIFKVLSREGYLEVQVDGRTAEVLSTSFRGDQLVEDIHDLSFFAEFAHALLLPFVALGLLALSVSGIVIFGTPVFRRWQFNRRKRGRAPPTDRMRR